jgi:hypothetical protein
MESSFGKADRLYQRGRSMARTIDATRQTGRDFAEIGQTSVGRVDAIRQVTDEEIERKGGALRV